MKIVINKKEEDFNNIKNYIEDSMDIIGRKDYKKLSLDKIYEIIKMEIIKGNLKPLNYDEKKEEREMKIYEVLGGI